MNINQKWFANIILIITIIVLIGMTSYFTFIRKAPVIEQYSAVQKSTPSQKLTQVSNNQQITSAPPPFIDNEPKLAVGVVSSIDKRKSVLFFNAKGELTNKVEQTGEIDYTDTDLNTPPAIFDWSLNKFFFASRLGIYNFKSNKIDNNFVDPLVFSPNGNLFYAPLSFREGSEHRIGEYDNVNFVWRKVDIRNVILPDWRNIGWSNPDYSHNYILRWKPNEPNVLLLLGLTYNNDNVKSAWLVDFNNGLKQANVVPLNNDVFYNLKKDNFDIDSFEILPDGKTALVVWREHNNFHNRKTDIVSFKDGVFLTEHENIENVFSKTFPLKENERFVDVRISVVDANKAFILKQKFTEEITRWQSPVSEEWWLYDFKNKSITKFFSEESDKVNNKYFWSPSNDFLMIRSEGKIRVISPDGKEILQDKTIDGYYTENVFSWDKSGNYFGYIFSANSITDGIRGPGGGIIKIFDLTKKERKEIYIAEELYMVGSQESSILLR